METVEAPRGEFSLTSGGPFYRLTRAARLARYGSRDVLRISAVVWLVAWVPMLLIAAVEWASKHRISGILLDLSAHARPLIVIPLFFMAEQALDRRSRRCTRMLSEWPLVSAEDIPRLDRLLAGAAKMRDSVGVELLLAALAVVGSQMVLWGQGGSLGLLARHGFAGTPAGASLWYGFVTLPLFQFLLLRWVWRWWIWSRILWGVSRLKLLLVPTHPDKAGGLMTIQDASVGFGWVHMGLSTLLASSWLGRVLFSGAQAHQFTHDFILFAVFVVLVTIGPLMVFAYPLWKVRHHGRWQYGHLALRYTRLFHRRWIEVDGEEGLLGSQDIQALADLGGSFEVLEKMQVVPFSRGLLTFLLAAIVVPMVPLMLTVVPLADLLKQLGGIVLGGIR